MVINSSFHIPPCASNFSKLIVSISAHGPYIIYSAQEVKRLHVFLNFFHKINIFLKKLQPNQNHIARCSQNKAQKRVVLPFIAGRNHENADKLPDSRT